MEPYRPLGKVTKIFDMDRETMKKFNEATDKGLDIFKFYLETPFELDSVTESEYSSETKFRVVYSEQYANYIIFLTRQFGEHKLTDKWNAVWFVKEIWGLSEKETYRKIDSEMNLGILKPKANTRPFELIDL